MRQAVLGVGSNSGTGRAIPWRGEVRGFLRWIAGLGKRSCGKQVHLEATELVRVGDWQFLGTQRRVAPSQAESVNCCPGNKKAEGGKEADTFDVERQRQALFQHHLLLFSPC